MIGKLKIENWKTEIGVIQIQPILDTNLLKEELRLIIEIYAEENEDDFEFDFNLSHIKMPNEVLNQVAYKGEFEFDETAIGLNEILFKGDEYEVKALKLNFLSDKKEIIGSGKVKNEDGELNFEFNGEYEIKELEKWKLDENLKKKNQVKSPNEIIVVLEQLANKEECIKYKKSVPFVHIPYELYSQWESSYRPEMKWFAEFYTKEEKERLIEFENLLKNVNQSYKNELPDVPEIFDLKEWQLIMNEAFKLKKEIKTVWNKASIP